MVNLNIKNGIDITASSNAIIPTGALIMKAIPPSALTDYDTDAECISAGFIPCDGRALNASTYSAYQNLFDIIGNIYGGTNNTNFIVPDLRTSRRYIYGKGTASGGVYTPSFSANTTNSVTHSHSLVTSTGNLATNNVSGNHTYAVGYGIADGGVSHYHNANANYPGLNATNAVGTTLTKSDGTGTAAGAAHGHSTGAFGTNSNSGNGGTTHNHSNGGLYLSDYSEPTHTHSISSPSVSIPNSSSIDIPYINVIYFIKI